MKRQFTLILGALVLLTATVAVHTSHAQKASSYVTRSEAALIILSNKGEKIPDVQANSVYPDVADGKWYTRYIVEAAKRGMIDPDKDGNLLWPNRAVTKGEFLKMLTVAYDLEESLPYQYVNIPPNAWFKKYVGLSYKHSLLSNPNDPQRIDANAFITYEEASKAVNKTITAYPNVRQVKRSTMQKSITRKITNTEFVYVVDKNKIKKKEDDKKIEVKKEKKKEEKKEKEKKKQMLEFLKPTKKKEESKQITSNMVKQAVIKLFQQNEIVADTSKEEIVDLINKERAKIGQPKIRVNKVLSAAAQTYAEDMWKRGYFSHFTPEGESYIDRIKNSGYTTPTQEKCGCSIKDCTCGVSFAVGENIAKGQLTTKQVMNEWMASPNHKKNILRKEFDEVGIGLYGDVWVQKFGSVKFR